MARLGGGGASAFGFRGGRMPGQPAEKSQHHDEGKANADDDADAIQDRLGMGFAAQGFHGLRVKFGLQRLELNFLVGNEFLLLGKLLFETRSDCVLPFLLLPLRVYFVELLNQLIAGISGIPNQAMGFGRRKGKRDWGGHLHEEPV